MARATRRTTPARLLLVDDAAADDGRVDGDLLERLGADGQGIIREDYEIGELSDLQAPLFLLLEPRPGRGHRVRPQRLLGPDPLLGDPAARLLAVDRGARDGGRDPGDRRDRRDVPG